MSRAGVGMVIEKLLTNEDLRIRLALDRIETVAELCLRGVDLSPDEIDLFCREWAYAGFTFMWIAAVVAHYLAGDGALSLLPAALIGSLTVSYVTRPANRRGSTKSMLA
jgi:hypothetical protein